MGQAPHTGSTMFLHLPPQPAPQPQLVTRPEVRYIGIESTETTETIGTVFPRLMPKLGAFLVGKKLHPAGAPFIQYVYVQMPKLKVILGMPVKEGVRGDRSVFGAVLPAGRYAELTYFGPFSGLEQANADLQTWCLKRHLKFKMRSGKQGPEFAARIESYQTDPAKEHDPSRWRTDLYYLLDR